MDPAPRWISKPWIDLLVGCGGWSAPLLLLSYLLVEQSAHQWAATFYALALVCNYPHYMATLHRAYARREDRTQHRLFTHGATALLVLAAIGAHVRLELLTYLFTIYVLWSPWHYTGQNFGLLVMFLRRNGIEVTSGVRRALRASFVASYVMLLASFNAGAPTDPLVLSLQLSDGVSTSIQIAAGAVFALAGIVAIARLATRASLAALAAPMALLSTQALWFVVPVALSGIAGAPTPQTRYSSGILAVMHSAQYLWVTRYFARRDALRRGEASQWSDLAYALTLVGGGILLFVPIPWLVSRTAHVDFTASMLIVTAVVNIHHFVIDGAVWKLRDPRVAQSLVASTEATRPSSRPSTRDVRAIPFGHPSFRIAALVLLSALALLDQWRYRLTLWSTNPAALETARVLNRHDSHVHLQLAVAAKDRPGAERWLRTAIDANPTNPIAYHRLLRLLVESSRFGEAYAHALAMLHRWPDDLDTLINAGVLASRLGDAAAAEQWWRSALARDASLLHVQRYLGDLLKTSGRMADAAVFYRGYMEGVRRLDPRQQRDPREVATVALHYGDVLAGDGRPDLARAQWRLAAAIATRSAFDEVLELAQSRLR